MFGNKLKVLLVPGIVGLHYLGVDLCEHLPHQLSAMTFQLKMGFVSCVREHMHINTSSEEGDSKQ